MLRKSVNVVKLQNYWYMGWMYVRGTCIGGLDALVIGEVVFGNGAVGVDTCDGAKAQNQH